jgi:protein-S-isoprenylcysteine O-methyltransferase Ste14
MFNSVKLPRGFLLLHPYVGWLSIPAALVWIERRFRLPRLRDGFWRFVGVPFVILGVAITSWGAMFLVIRGQGTADPNHPPQVLVQQGPYGYTRNPLVIGAVLTLLGVGLRLRSLLLLLYVAALAPVLQFYHVRTEEPDLVERFGQAYLDYRQRVPRWLPRAPRAVAEEAAGAGVES